MPNPPQKHPAYQDLVRLISQQNFRISDADNWRVGAVDQNKAQKAAVLILFGVLDQNPAHHAGAYPEQVGADLDLLIVVRATTLRKHAGQPAFPGGKIDPEDYLLAQESGQPVSYIAALREAVEETGLDPAGVEILGELPEVPLPVSNFLVTPVLAWWAASSSVEAQDTRESAQVLRVPVADLINPRNRHLATVTVGTQTHKSPAFSVTSPEGNFTIWGFTGVILGQLLEALGWEEPWDRTDHRPAPGYTP